MLASAGAIQISYAHDRRRARHRCRCCNRILNAGEQVVMAKVADRATYAIHVEPCAGKPHGNGPMTWRETMAAWAAEHAHKLGVPIARQQIQSS